MIDYPPVLESGGFYFVVFESGYFTYLIENARL